MSNELFLNLVQKMEIENISLSFGTIKEKFNSYAIFSPVKVFLSNLKKDQQGV